MKKVCILMILLVAAFTVLTACKGGSNNNTTVTPTGAPTSYYHRCGGEITLGEYKGLKATQQKTVVSEADIDAEIAGLLETQPNYEKDPTRDGTLVKEGDALNIDYAGKIAGGALLTRRTAGGIMPGPVKASPLTAVPHRAISL